MSGEVTVLVSLKRQR